jgi:FkbM family methyltransferase
LANDVFTRFEESCTYLPDWLGVKTSAKFFDRELGLVKLGLPAIDREIFEWEALLEAVMAARDEFVMFELGAGYGRWTVSAARAVEMHSGMPYRLVAVEPEPDHFRWLKEHVRTNRLARRRVRLIEAAVSDREGTTELYAGEPSGWYGQALVDIAGQGLDHPLVKVKTVTLSRLLERFEWVDLIHLDVQGAELRVLRESAESLSKVRRIFVETHSEEIENDLRELLPSLGWRARRDYALRSTASTPWGEIEFDGGGVQAWVNGGSE